MSVVSSPTAKILRVTTRDSTGAILHDTAAAPAPSPAIENPKSQIQNLPEPTRLEMLGHAGTALLKWTAAGFAIAPPEIRAARYATCQTCHLWDDSARLGLGKCKHPGCGCTKLKLALLTEKCPLHRWSS